MFSWLRKVAKATTKKYKKGVESDTCANLEPAPCGNQEMHYYWTEEGWPCPICTKKENKKKLREDEQRRADMLAKAIVKEMRGGNITIH